jgi:hypothetical protein
MSDKAAVLSSLFFFALVIALWCVMGFVAYHFASKFW